jgi:ATP-binding cassette subfamily B protein
MKMIRRILPYLNPYRWQWLAYLALSVVVSLLQLLVPWPLKIIVDNVLSDVPLSHWATASIPSFIIENKIGFLVALVLATVVLKLLTSGANLWSAHISVKIRQTITLKLKGELFQRLQQQSLKYHNNRRLGDLLYRITTDVWGIDELIVTIVPVIMATITIVGMLAVMAYLNWSLAALSLLILPLFYYTYVFYSNKFDRRVDEVQRLEGESMSVVQEVLSALPVVKSFTREAEEHARFLNQGQTAKEARVRLTILQVIYAHAVGLITTIGTSLVLGYGAYEVLENKLTLGELLIIIAYLNSVYTPLESVYTAVTYTHGYLAKMRRIFDVLDSEPDIDDRPGAQPLLGVCGKITFENVTFGYDGTRQALRHVTFEVPQGQVVGIVGHTGAGKTSLVSLVLRFFDPDEGRVCIDDHDLKDIQLKSLRQTIGIVLQDPILLSGTIRENIGYGKPDATTQEIVEAAKAANAHEFIMQLADGYETNVGERGVKLSGGERQRISIARTFLKNAPILILDEPTSSVDYRTEATILKALERLMDGRTVIIIAHRLSTLAAADKIITLEAGKIVEVGTHQDLLKAHGTYAELYHKGSIGKVAINMPLAIFRDGYSDPL